MSMTDFKSELGKLATQSPTEDQKLAFLKNTMVPRKLDQFDDIKEDFDVIKENNQLDRVSLYANYKVSGFRDGREYGRSYRINLPEIEEYVADEIFESQIKVDDNFDEDVLRESKKIELKWDASLQENLVDELKHLEDEIYIVDSTSKQRDELKQDKFIIFGDADKVDADGKPELDSEGHPVPNPDESGVNVKYITKDSERFVKISHEEIIGNEGWKAQFSCGGVAQGRYFSPSTSLREVLRMILYGDPQFSEIIYYGAMSTKPTTVREALANMAPSAVAYDQLLKGFSWPTELDMTGKMPFVMMPESMWNNATMELEGRGLPEYAGHKNLEIDAVWPGVPYMGHLKDADGNDVIDPDTGDPILVPVDANKVDVLPEPIELIFEDIASGTTVPFKVWYVDEYVQDDNPEHDKMVWTFRFKEVA